MSKVYFILNLFSYLLHRAAAVRIACVSFLQHVHLSPCHVIAVYADDIPWLSMICLCACYVPACKKGMVDVKSLSKKCREVAISLLNASCFCCCTVLQQAKAFPCKRGILYNAYSGCLVSILQLRTAKLSDVFASNPNLAKFGIRNYLLRTCILLWNIFRDPRRRNDGCCAETSFA